MNKTEDEKLSKTSKGVGDRLSASEEKWRKHAN